MLERIASAITYLGFPRSSPPHQHRQELLVLGIPPTLSTRYLLDESEGRDSRLSRGNYNAEKYVVRGIGSGLTDPCRAAAPMTREILMRNTGGHSGVLGLSFVRTKGYRLYEPGLGVQRVGSQLD